MPKQNESCTVKWSKLILTRNYCNGGNRPQYRTGLNSEYKDKRGFTTNEQGEGQWTK